MHKQVPEFLARLRARRARKSHPETPMAGREIFDFMTALLQRDDDLQGATLVLSSGQQMAILPLYRDGMAVPTKDLVVLQQLLQQELALRLSAPASGTH